MRTLTRLPRLFTLVLLLLSAFCLPSYPATASYCTLSGTFIDSLGTPISGKLVLHIPYAGLITNEGSYLASTYTTLPIYQGQFLPPSPVVVPNSDINPTGTYYVADLYDSSGYLVEESNLIISGSTFNVGQAIQTSVTTTQISYANPLVTPINPQIGDTLRDNVLGDGQWDAVNFAGPVSVAYPVWGGAAGTTPLVFGPMNTGNTFSGVHTSINSTATTGTGDQWSTGAGASPNAFGWDVGQNGNNSIEGIIPIYRYSTKIQISSLTNARYWIGLATFTINGPLGTNGTAITGTTRYASDTPNGTTLGFRYSATTDTHWQAVSIKAGTGQTTVDTGITPDLLIHTFEFAPNSTGTAVTFIIDGQAVANISTNLPDPSQGQNSWGNMFCLVDNKNTANNVSITLYYAAVAHK